MKFSVSKEEDIPPEEEDNLNKSSGEDEEMYSWDELEYKVNYVRFIMCMVRSALEDSQEDNPDDSIVAGMRLNISPPEEYSGSSDLKCMGRLLQEYCDG